MTEVRVGQVYADNDPRSASRTLRVDAIDEGKAACTVLTNTDETQQYVDGIAQRPTYMEGAFRDRRGTQIRIKLSRFAPTSTGYRLIEDAEV